MGCLLGIDVGTSATKGLVCDERGKVLATASADYPLYTPKPGWSEQDPEDWWWATRKVTRAVLRKAKKKGADVIGIGLSGQMHGSVFLGDGTKPLRRALLWNDQRTVKQCVDIESAVGGRKKLIKMVSNPALTGYTAPKILWLRDNEPRVYDEVKHILLPKDYIRLLMTGEYASEVSDASGTLLLDVKKRQWCRPLLSKLQIDADLLPPVYESVEISGRISRGAAKELGIPAGVPIVGGGGDQAAGAVGNGIVKPGIVSASMGTSGVVFSHLEDPATDVEGRLQTFCHAVPGKWAIFGCVMAAGGSFQWFRNELGHAEVAAAKKKRVDPYDLLIAEAAKADPGCEGLFFLPYLMGERCPHADPDARACWIGLSSRHDRSAMIRAMLEGITFGMNEQYGIMRDLGVRMRETRASGGGARSAWWRQLQADVYNTKVVTTNSREGPAYGVALLAAVATGCFSSVEEACRRAIGITDAIKPDRKLARRYAAHYDVYRRLYYSLKDDFAAIARLAR